ncbi:MAG: hypothetical protein AVDCRST_MAG50-2128 [uncultured Acidimicrobiales bacterium]|uniref:Uncharacterized protein n=1 Tax=uncultured Acidimicrobiales bacterium TaxID=310071 RepID=A0A6J4I1J6_9ACTN|nr:MAG: hypothetical protein AVDCRST_MAG50-2128 [uncultured Acidimicrobiales bacterium]
MRKEQSVETGRDRMVLAKDAGMGKVSLISVLAGVLVAYGAFAVIAAITAAVLNAVGVDTASLSDNDWRDAGIAGAAITAFVLLLSYLFGGYVAGRMARRAGALNGLLVFVLSVVIMGAIAALLSAQTDTEQVTSNLRSLGLPTTGEEWKSIGTAAGLGSLLAMLLGSVLGGILGERWHGKLMKRALDPSIGSEANAIRQSENAEAQRLEAEQRRMSAGQRREIDLRDGAVPNDNDNTVVVRNSGDATLGTDDVGSRTVLDADGTVRSDDEAQQSRILSDRDGR